MTIKFNIGILIIIMTILFSCSNNETETIFCAHIGLEKADILFEAVESLDKFLDTNFKQSCNKNQQIVDFLEYLKNNDYQPSENWIYNIQKDKKIIDNFEKTGLRKDIWKYGFEIQQEIEFLEEEEIIPITRDSVDSEIEENYNYKNDSTRYASDYSSTVISMLKTEIKDSLIIEYINAKVVAGNFSPSLFLGGFLEKKDKYNYDNLFAKIIIVNEVYYGLLRQNIEANE